MGDAWPEGLIAGAGEWLRHQRDRFELQAAVLAVVAAGKQAVVVGGDADRDSRFALGSVTKPLVAARLLRLLDGAALDRPVGTWLPELGAQIGRPDGWTPTVRQLLCHATGWGEARLHGLPTGDDALSAAMRRASTVPRLAPPGRLFSYSDWNYVVLGRLLERLAGRPFREALGLGDAVFQPSDLGASRRIQVAEDPAGGAQLDAPAVLALTRWAAGLPPDDGGPDFGVPAAELLKPQLPTGWLREAIGLGAWCVDSDAGLLLRHGGAVPGYHSILLSCPARGAAVCVVGRGERGMELCGEATSWWARGAFGVWMPWPEAAVVADRPEDYVGTYGDQPGDQLQVGRGRDGRMRLDGETRIDFWARDRFLAQDGPQGDFVRDRSGRVAWLRWHNTLRARQG